jgi:tetratricopeptide (TPR) repeat protein/mono/diheme cytochrome c family protein
VRLDRVLPAIGLAAFLGPSPAQAQSVTFNKDIAPIVFAHCAGCHRPGEIGPFDLLTYRDVRQRATQIAAVTARRIMPPWKPSAAGPNVDLPEFLDQRALTEAQIQRIQDWVAQGAVEGDANDLPPAPRATTSSEWQLGTPDLVVSMSEPYVVPAGGADLFRTFVIPIPVRAARYVRALEFRPGNPRVVHHVNLGVDRTSSSRRLDALDPAPGYFGNILPAANYPPGQMLGWTPGQRPRPAPAGTQWRLDAGSDLVVQLHLQPTGKPEPVQASVGLFFTDEAPRRTPVGLRLGRETIDIAPGEREHVIIDRFVLPVDVEVIAIQPHAHNLARRMEVTATLPDGTTRPLISIADWDFRWQEVYRYARPYALPKGTAIAMRYTYDNSADNPRNPHQPPKRVVWGQNTSDEMGDLWVQVVPRTGADLAALNNDIGRKMRAEDLAAYTRLLQADPNDASRHDGVAILYLQGGQTAEAIPHLRESLRLLPESAPTRYNLGLAFSGQRRFEEALSQFSEAVRIDPDHADAHNSLGALLHAVGRLDEAVAHYRRAVALRPDHVEAHGNLGHTLFLQGRAAEAIAEFRAALDLRRDWATALAGLTWVLAASSDAGVRDADEAVRLAERAAALTHNADALVLDALGASYAAAGRFDRAVGVARSAADLAAAAGQTDLAAQIRQRLALYERGMAFRITP